MSLITICSRAPHRTTLTDMQLCRLRHGHLGKSSPAMACKRTETAGSSLFSKARPTPPSFLTKLDIASSNASADDNRTPVRVFLSVLPTRSPQAEMDRLSEARRQKPNPPSVSERLSKPRPHSGMLEIAKSECIN